MGYPTPNNYPYWFYQSIPLPGVGDTIRATFPLPSSTHYMLRKILVQWTTDGGAPSDFENISFILHNQTFGVVESELPIDFRLTSTPGIYEPGVGGSRNQQYLGAKSIEWFFLSTSVPELQISNFNGPGNPGTLDIVLQGQRILKQGVFT